MPSSASSSSAPKNEVKIKVLSRDKAHFTRQRQSDTIKVFRNPAPKLHPFEQQREYTRAIKAVKLNKMFSKPFIAALDGHSDSVTCMTNVGGSLTQVASGSADGEVRMWDLQGKNTAWKSRAHDGFVKGLCSDKDGKYILSCGSDRTIKLYNTNALEYNDDISEKLDSGNYTKKNAPLVKPVVEYLGGEAFTGISHSFSETAFATSSTKIDIWDPERAEPVHSFQWGADEIHSCKYNPVETNILVSTASDRNIVLYDTRQRTPLKKIIMQMATNEIAWNPMQGFTFTTANEDAKLYTFDMRYLQSAVNVHTDHMMAVMGVSYSPTGQEFVSGSYDKTIRIYNAKSSKSREIYHTKRMQRVYCVHWTQDDGYILSGSDDTNIRMWKAKANRAQGITTARDRRKRNYGDRLIQKYKHAPIVKKIKEHQILPKMIHTHRKMEHIQRVKKRRIDNNIRKNDPNSTRAKKARPNLKNNRIEKELD